MSIFASASSGRQSPARSAPGCAEHHVIAQYRCNTTNKALHALAKALNFRLFFHSESLWLAD
jgi:hypothetical protein